MTTIRISEFHGLIPKVDHRKLPQGYASVAKDTRFDAGDLSPIRKGVAKGTVSGDCGNLFHLSDRDGLGRYLSFGAGMDVYYMRGPVPDDQHERIYWCVYRPGVTHTASLAFDGIRCLPQSDPYPHNAPTGTGSSYRQHAGYRVGIPAPANAPEASDESVLGRVENVGLSATNPITVSASDVPFSAGELVRIVIDPSLPTGEEQQDTGELPDDETPPPEPENNLVGRLWQLSGKEGRVSNIGVSGVNTFDIVGVSGAALGSERLTTEERQAISIERVIKDSELETRAYVFTHVSKFDEEGPPSAPSNIIDVPAAGATVHVTISNGDTSGGDLSNANRVRVYRKVAGSRAGAYLFVGETAFSSTSQPVTFVDNVSEVELGEPLPSEKWYPPPLGLQGAHLHPAGYMVAWKGNTLYFSEPYLPHAWNPDYKRTVDSDIVNVQTYGNTMVIGTTGRPYVATGVDPASVSIRKLDTFAPVQNHMGMVDAGQGVIYPSSVGLMLVTTGGAKNITEGLFDKKTWSEEMAAFERGIYHDERVIFFGRGVIPWVLDFNGGKAELSRLSTGDYGAACVADTDLVFVRREGSTYRRLVEFKSSASTEVMVWRSGLLTMQQAVNMAAGQVFATDYQAIKFKLFWADLHDGQARLTQSPWVHDVEGPEPFRLPATYRSREFVIEIESTERIQEILLSTSMEEIRRV